MLKNSLLFSCLAGWLFLWSLGLQAKPFAPPDDEFTLRYTEAKRQLHLLMAQNAENDRQGLSHLNRYIYSDDPEFDYVWTYTTGQQPNTKWLFESFYGDFRAANETLKNYNNTTIVLSSNPYRVYFYVTGVFAKPPPSRFNSIPDFNDALEMGDFLDGLKVGNSAEKLQELLGIETADKASRSDEFTKQLTTLHYAMAHEVALKDPMAICYTMSAAVISTEIFKKYHLLHLQAGDQSFKQLVKSEKWRFDGEIQERAEKLSSFISFLSDEATNIPDNRINEDERACVRLLFTHHRDLIGSFMLQAALGAADAGLLDGVPGVALASTVSDLTEIYRVLTGTNIGWTISSAIEGLQELDIAAKQRFQQCVQTYFTQPEAQEIALPETVPTYILNIDKIATAQLSPTGTTGIEGITFRPQDNFIDVIVHSQNGKFIVWIDAQKREVSESFVAMYIDSKIPRDKILRLLSCADIESTKRLSLALGKRAILASDAPLKLYHDGTVAGGRWFWVRGAETMPTENHTPPTGETDTDKFVWLGGGEQNGSSNWVGNTYTGNSYSNISQWGNPDLEYPKLENGILKTLRANSIYKVDNYTYFTDGLGRVAKVEGVLELNSDNSRARLPQGYQHKIEYQDKIDGDDGGHLIAIQFKGPNECINIVPMRSDLNRNLQGDGAWRKMEIEWANALYGRGAYTTPQIVKVQIEIEYNDTGRRPERFKIEYKIGNTPTIVELFYN
ncbi:MAG TPA: hypothetical protein DCM08_03350 [Microscillaceae bacterium]|nr:hypothetical protein [Microscillaceae bacterium]